MERHLRKGLLFVIILLGAVGCSDAPVPLAPLAPDAVVLAFGDSLTRGTGAKAGNSYPDQLAQLIGREVVNEGIPGEVSAAGRARLADVLDRVQPALLILCHGGNDILRGLSKEQLQENLQAMIDMARTRDIDVVLVAVPQRSLLLRQEPTYEDLASKNQLPLEATIVAEILSDASLRADRIHPNGTGYRELALALQTLLQNAGAL